MKIVVIEDDPIDVKMLMRKFKGVTFLWFTSIYRATQYLESAAHMEIDLVLIDVNGVNHVSDWQSEVTKIEDYISKHKIVVCSYLPIQFYPQYKFVKKENLFELIADLVHPIG